MNLAMVEAVVHRLFADADFRTKAIADPASTLAQYDLGETERTALTKLCGRLSDGSVEPETQLDRWW